MKRIGLVLAAAFVFWGAVLVQSERSVFALVPLLDEVWYLDRAAELDGLAAPASQAHFMSPLYPVLMKLVGAGGGVPADRVVPPSSLRLLRGLQIVCWLAVAALLRRAAGSWLPEDLPRRRWLVWLPTLLFALYRPAAVYALAVLVELPLLLLITLATVLLVQRQRAWWQAPLLGTALGLAGLLRGTALVLVPVAVVVLLAAGSRRGRRDAVMVVLAAVAMLLPASLHNSRISGRPVGPTLNAGVNLVVGNGPEANGFYVSVVPGDWRADPAGRTHLARQLGRKQVTLAAADSIWTARALATAAERPVATAGLWLRKVWLHLQAWEIDQLTPLEGWRRTVPLLGIFVVPWALLVVLAGVGIADLARRRPAGWWILPAAAGALLAAQSVFFVVSRYRLALLPMLALLAALGCGALLRRAHRAWIAVPLAVLLVVPWGLGPVQERWQAQALANEALRRADLGQARGDAAEIARAGDLYRQALDRGADGAAPWLGLAAVLRAQDDPAGAAEVLARGILHQDRHLEMRKVLISLLLEQGRSDEAMARLQALLVQWPDDADALHNMTILLAGTGRVSEAVSHAQRLVAAAADDPRGYNDLGILLARLGRRQEAVDVFRRGLAVVPHDPDLAANLGRIGGAEPDSVE